MNRIKGRTARLAGLVALVLGAAALLALPGVAAAKDRNHDRIPDRWETRHHLSLTVNQAGRDQDNDGLRNRDEFRAGDNPRDDDSDGDGVMDGAENAGTIASFDAASGRLTIALFGGETLSGTVDATTEIRCEGVEHPNGDDRRLSHEGEPGDDRGGHGEEPGDDNGGQGQEPGDDNGGQGQEPGDDNGGHGQEPGDDNGGAAGGDNSGPGSANSGPGNADGEDHANCTTAALVPGAVVQEAELHASGGVAIFEEVELAHTN